MESCQGKCSGFSQDGLYNILTRLALAFPFWQDRLGAAVPDVLQEQISALKEVAELKFTYVKLTKLAKFIGWKVEV